MGNLSGIFRPPMVFLDFLGHTLLYLNLERGADLSRSWLVSAKQGDLKTLHRNNKLLRCHPTLCYDTLSHALILLEIT